MVLDGQVDVIFQLVKAELGTATVYPPTQEADI